MKVTIVLGGDVRVSDLMTVSGSDAVIAADSGLEAALALGMGVTAVVGDMDSVDPDVLESVLPTTKVVRHPADKDFTDFELALEVADELEPTELVVVGASGGRFDHELANIAVLSDPRRRHMLRTAPYRDGRVDIVDGTSLDMRGIPGELFSLVALGGPATVSITGAKWDLELAELSPFRALGISNEFAGEHVTVTVSAGVVLAVRPGLR